MAEALGGRYDLAHGVTNAILLPTVSEFNIPANPKKYARIAKALGLNTHGMSESEAAMAGVEELRQLCADVGIPKMREIDIIKPEDFPELAKEAEANVSTPSNPCKIVADDFLALFKKAYEG